MTVHDWAAGNALLHLPDEERPRLWVWALPDITGAGPVAPGDGGKIAEMGEAWLRWGREHGYRW